MRKIFCLCLFCLLCFQLTGCHTHSERDIPTEETSASQARQDIFVGTTDTSLSERTQNEAALTETTVPVATNRTTAKKTTAVSTTSAAKTTTRKTNSEAVGSGSVGATEMETTEGIEEPPQLSEDIQIENIHTPLSADKYYQYGGLSAAKKNVYAKLLETIQSGETFADLQKLGCSLDAASRAFAALIADHPQLFYVSKSFGYVGSGDLKTVKQLIILYFDGQTEDTYDAKGRLTETADRNLIGQQIREFNKKIAEILAGIPQAASDFEKEKQIYEYLQDTVTYDNSAASAVSEGNTVYSHAFDAFGAACENLAVCEGYAELFQYLCYCVNINATQVSGTSFGGAHLWNAVCLDAEWYMVDVTWDDSAKQDLHCYGYFNLTEAEIVADHTIDYDTLQVPSCRATTYAFYNWYGLYAESSFAPPANYAAVMDYLAESSERYLCVYVGNLSGDVKSYIQKYILSSASDLQKYVAQKGYGLAFQLTYYTRGKYCYIPLK